ncbi:MAG TPA: hypothetical protein DDY32_02700 [Desulfobulbaceae bacterium]|nr:hypothetical protein [Desulfobulbaceae bacterium]
MGLIHPALYWLIIGVILFVLEMVLPGFILFFFAVGALVTALIAYLFPIGAAWQLTLFMVASLLSLFLLRDLIQKRFFSTAQERQETDIDRVLIPAGERGVVSVTIAPPGEGRIKCAGSSWRATADERIEEGEIVAVVRQKGLVIHVEKV